MSQRWRRRQRQRLRLRRRRRQTIMLFNECVCATRPEIIKKNPLPLGFFLDLTYRKLSPNFK
jgi:hypothetical protein